MGPVLGIDAVWAWNEHVPSFVNETVHDLVHKQACLQPDALAVEAHDGTWTYAELDATADRVAHFLVHLGVQSEHIIPLCFEKSRWAVIAILAVLKAGAAFVFLDPSHPTDRRQHIVAEVEAKVIVSSPSQAHLYEKDFPPTFTLSEESLETLPEYDTSPSTTVTPANLLYVIYTSGSTGKPKGCLIEHRAFLSGSIRHAERAKIDHCARILQLASYTFDVSMLEILTALVHGSCICTPDLASMNNGPAYLINEYNITWTFLTPSLVKLMAPGMVPTLKTLALGGEPLSKIDVQTWSPHVKLINGYGPSECSVAAAGNTEMDTTTDPANIGYPVGGICWIVDADNHDILLPPGETGELLIEGPILARGYLKNKAKTEEVFIEQPVWGPTTKIGEIRRCYKTGDLAKRLPDGSIYFVGRKDTQVKLRGLRIELGEIEQNVGADSQVNHQVVVLPKEGLFTNRLVAVVSFKEHLIDQDDSMNDLIHVHHDLHGHEVQILLQSVRENLASKVPSYMVPETWVVLGRFPLLPSGKLDRALISSWIATADEKLHRQIVGIEEGSVSFVAQNGVEEKLGGILASVLNLPLSNVTFSKSFLSLGGDSITAMQVMSRCRAVRLAVGVKDILRSRSISDLLLCIRPAGESFYSTEELLDAPFELSPVQRMYFDIVSPEKYDSCHTRFNQSFFLKLERSVVTLDVVKALELIVSQHSMLRVRFAQEEKKWMQYIPSNTERSFNFKSYEVDTVHDAYPIMDAIQNSLDMQHGPVFAVALFTSEIGGQYLFLVAHHVMIDLVSWRIILRDLEEVLTTGHISPMKSIPFQNWLDLQTEHSKATDVSSVLPYDVPAPDFDYWGMSTRSNHMCDTKTSTIKLDLSQTEELLKGDCHLALNTEPIDIILASLIFSFSQTFNDRSAPAIFREGHGREPFDDNIDISNTVGWFTTMYPFYVKMQKHLNVIDVVRRAKDVRHSVPANGRPYFASRYLNDAGIARFGSHNLVETSFDYLGLYQQMERDGSLLRQVPGYQAILQDVGQQTPRFALIEVTAEVLQGQMQLLFIYNKHMKHQDQIRSWIQNTQLCIADALTELKRTTFSHSLADFPLMTLSYNELDLMLSKKLPEIGILAASRVERICPSTPMQHGLLISQVRDTFHGVYEYFHTLKVETRDPSVDLHVQRLADAWRQVVQRHSSLRTVFMESVRQSGLYDQISLKALDSHVSTYKCSLKDVDNIFESRDKLTFRPGSALHRFTICRVSRTTAICKLEINHAIIDISSIAVLVGDFILAYDGRLPKQPGFVFEDYVKHVVERPLGLAINFWEEYLAGINPCLFPSMAHREVAVKKDADCKLETVTVDLGISFADLRTSCDSRNVTIVNVFQLAWGLVLKQYTGTDDVCFGYLSAGRDAPLAGIDEGVGAFITMLVSRMKLSDTTNMSTALMEVADDLIRALPNQHCGLAEIHHALNLGNQPLFNTVISFHHDIDNEPITDSSIQIEALQGYDPTEYALSLDVGVNKTDVKVCLQFWTLDFTFAQANNIGATLAEAVKAVIDQPDEAIGAIDLVPQLHIQQLLEMNAVYPQSANECIHHIIEAQAQNSPDSEAICSYEGNWTYAELNERANYLAHYLVLLGVGPEIIVPYLFEKSAWAIVSILAILKAGGAGVALDPTHPIERLNGLIKQTESRVILASKKHSELFANVTDVKNVITVNADFVTKLPQIDGPACTNVQPENACFVVFTSGTSGKPKGVVLEHCNVRTCSVSMGEVLGFGPSTRTLQFAAYNFDVSIQDIMTTLQFGGTVCVISDEERMNNLAGGINRTRATWADLTATVIGMLDPEDVPSLRRLNNGGEPLNRDIVERWADRIELYNLYGPAETTINNTASVRLSRSSTASNIGRAYGTHVWIVNDQDHNRLVPLGCAGEILIEGPLLARGYLKGSAVTAAAFIENPSWVANFPNPQALQPRRFYKSGDIGCLNNDGSVTIMGRRDAQVKINGQRIELDEIMYQAQSALPEGYLIVIDAISVDKKVDNKMIVGFIAHADFTKCNFGTEQSIFEIDDQLRRILDDLQASLTKVIPLYMIPLLFVPVLKIPYTASGKLARTSLRQIVADFTKEQISHYMLRSAFVDQPRTSMEQTLQNLFAETLSMETSSISRDDNFFGLGGDSVGAMKMIGAARKYNIHIQVADIFKHPILRELAGVLQESPDTIIAEEVSPFSLVDNQTITWTLAQAAVQCNITVLEIEDIYPTSPLQEGMMVLGMKQRGAYMAQKVFRLPRDLDIASFQHAWKEVVEKEAILRTRMVSSDSGILQLVTKLPIMWQSSSDLGNYLAEDLNKVFQYGEPMMRLALVNNEYFVWTAHHSIYDGPSLGLLLDKVTQVYSGVKIRASIPFRNFVGHLTRIDTAESIDFWKQQLMISRSCPISWPETSPGYTMGSKQTMTLSAAMPSTTSDILSTTIKRAAWAMTMATYADCEDVVFAQTLAGRNLDLAGINDIMGPTITTVPIRLQVPKGGVTVRKFLEGIQQQSVTSIEHEHFGLQNLRNIGADARTTIDSIANLFVIQPAEDNWNTTLGLEVVTRPEQNFDTYPLVVLCNLGKGAEVMIEAIYDEAVIHKDQMERVLNQYVHIVRELSREFDRPIETITLLNEHDFKDISNWNAEIPESIDICIPDLVARNITNHPGAPAVCAWDGTLTYGELDSTSSKLSNHLLTLDVGPEVKVGLCFDKSLWNIVSMFAVMRIGGVCVQLLPDYPMPRMLSILEDINADVVLTSTQHGHIFEGIVPYIVCVDQSFVDSLPDAYSELKAPDYGPDNAAFVVFTSGSTGKPKGVVIEHRSFCTMAHYQLPQLLLQPSSRVLQFATHSFDICLFESFSPLIKGACVCVPSEHDRMNNLAGAINSLKVDWAIMVSTVAGTFHPYDVPGLKTLVLGGEPLRSDIHARWAQCVRLFNDYGPAECSILAVMTRSRVETPYNMIGKAYGGRSWIVDKSDHNHLVPVGCIGELLIEGPLLARGYLKDTMKDSEAYISDPIWARGILPGSKRLYKTGDLVRYVHNGSMLFLGRKDTQIKIRGLRVELGEIEHHVKIGIPGTHMQAVENIFLNGASDKAAIAAFIVPNCGDIEDRNEGVLKLSSSLRAKFCDLKNHISNSLPSYMVPSLYIPLRKIPQTQSNKIDRNALKRIGAALTTEQIRQYSLDGTKDSISVKSPSTPNEIALQNMWAELLHVDPASVGIEDNFFSKGGDSIKAMRLTTMARSAGLTLVVADIFKYPILYDMAKIAISSVIEAAVNIEPFSLSPLHGNFLKDVAKACNVSTDSIMDIYPCTPLQEGLMELTTQREGAYTAQRMFKLNDRMDIRRFKAAWNLLVALHPILRTRIILSSTGGAFQVVLKEGISWQPETTLQDYLIGDKAALMQYGSPLARYALDNNHMHFIWTAHHALYDAHAASILMKQLEALYKGERTSTAIDYNRFIKFVINAENDDFESFWKNQLGQGIPAAFPSLPGTTYQPSPDAEVARSIEINRHTNNGYMLSTILRAAWAIVTSRYMGSEDVVFAATNSGRNAPIQGIENIVGPTITTVPIRLKPSSEASVTDFLATVQQQSINMIPYEHAGIQKAYAMAKQKQNIKNLFVIQQPAEDLKQGSLLEEVTDKKLLRGFHTYPVVVECMVVSDHRIDVEFHFDSKVLLEASAKIVLEQFEFLVHQLISSTQTTLLKDLELVTPAHYQKMIEWNNLVEIHEIDDCVHNIFRQQVQIRPDATAVTSWDGSLTYKRLDELSDRLAAYLVDKGVKSEYLVPMCFDKSLYAIVAMMATIKAGGACVHLGNNTPINRMSGIIKQTNASIVLCDGHHATRFSGIADAIIVDSAMLDNLSSTVELPTVSPKDPAFVLFTSGSTGTPKGVVVEHGSLCTSSWAHGSNRNVGPETRLLQFAAYTFDVSVADIFTTLQRGGCICVPSEDERVNDLAGAINRMCCNYGFLTPTVAAMLKPESIPTLKTLVLGGEMLTQDNIHQWAPAVDLISSYGMTECSIHCVDATPLAIKSNPADLGRPSGCHMWLVEPNDHNKLVPLGAVGELVIEGRVVSRGYLGDDENKNSAFIFNPTWAQGTGKTRRMYKTGDLCKYSAEGTMCFVSRKDHQVKHHGQRIELCEVEHHILADTRVNQAVVLLPQTGFLQKKLVAVVSMGSFEQTPRSGTQLALLSGVNKGLADVQVSIVRNNLSTKLPDYMVPAIWIAVAGLPLTANNKLDRVITKKWLEEMGEEIYETIAMRDKEESGVPATEQQKILHDLLCSVLGLPSINMTRSFLDCGGDSITAMKLRAKCQASGISLLVRDILTCESISHLTIKFRAADGRGEEERTRPFALTAWQSALLEKEASPQPISVSVTSSATVPQLVRALEALVQQHCMLRTRFSSNEQGTWIQAISDNISSSYSLEIHSIRSLSTIADFTAHIKSMRWDLDIENGPLMSVQYLDVTESPNQRGLALAVHPMVADNTSMQIIVDDLRKLLQGDMVASTDGASFRSSVLNDRHHLEIDVPRFHLSRWGLQDKELLGKDLVKRSITLASGTTCSLLGVANKTLASQPIDIIVSVIAKTWSIVFGRCASIAILDEARADRVVGQFSRLRQLPQFETNDLVQLLREVKDIRVFELSGLSLRNAIPEVMDVIVEPIEYTALNDEQVSSGSSIETLSVMRISALVKNGEIAITFAHSANIAQQTTITSFITVVEEMIPDVVETLSNMSPQPSLADFPQMDMEYSHLAALEQAFAKIHTSYANVQAVVPCTPLQQRMLDCQKVSRTSYISTNMHKIVTGGDVKIDIACLQNAWRRVTARHEVLRTIFIPSVWRNHESDQLVLKIYEPIVNVIECDEASLCRIITNHQTVLHSGYNPQVRLTLFRTPSALYTKLEISHALQDGMSTRVIYQDLADAYQGLLPTDAAPPFREYVNWLTNQDLSPSEHFWDNHLDKTPPCIIPRKIANAHAKGTHVLIPITVNIAQDTTKKLCRTHKITPATLFQSAWVLLLHHIAQTDAILFGYMTANRDLDIPGIDSIVGLMINMLACSLSVSKQTSIKDVLKRTHDVFLETLKHQHSFVSAARKKEALEGRLPFNSVLSVEYASDDEESTSGGYFPAAKRDVEGSLGFEVIGGTRAPEFDVVLGVLLGERSVEVQLGYWDGVIDQGLMQKVARMYAAVVEELVELKFEGCVNEVKALVV